MLTRKSTAVWQGNGMNGKGTLDTQSGVFQSFMLTGAGHEPERLTVSASVKLDKADGHFFIAAIALDLEGKVPGITESQFLSLAEAAKQGCPVSKALAATPITLSARLVG